MPKLLEVIVTSEDEALEAEDGGADRLELVRELGLGGLTPSTELAARVVRRVAIPVRVMIRESPTLEAGGTDELHRLAEVATGLAVLPIDGLVAGFARDHQLDVAATATVLAGAPSARVTFHRAFDEAADPLLAIEQLKLLPQVDRILTDGGPGTWQQRRERLNTWQTAAAPIKLLVGAGLSAEALAGLRLEPCLQEVHVGRAARVPETVDGRICSKQIAAIKSALE